MNSGFWWEMMDLLETNFIGMISWVVIYNPGTMFKLNYLTVKFLHGHAKMLNFIVIEKGNEAKFSNLLNDTALERCYGGK